MPAVITTMLGATPEVVLEVNLGVTPEVVLITTEVIQEDIDSLFVGSFHVLWV